MPVVLTHLLGESECDHMILAVNIFATLTFDPGAGATDGMVSQLERLVFSESFVKEEAEEGAGGHSRAKLPCLDQSDKQATFSRHFGQVPSQILLLVSSQNLYHRLLKLLLKSVP